MLIRMGVNAAVGLGLLISAGAGLSREIEVEPGANVSEVVNAAKPGDVIILKNGNHKAFGVKIKGTEEEPITIKAEEALKATVQGGIRLTSAEWLIIEGLDLTGELPEGKYSVGLKYANGTNSNLIIRKCNMRDGKVGIDSYKRAFLENILYEDCDIFNNIYSKWSDGVAAETGGKNMVFRRCKARDNGYDGFDLKGDGVVLVECLAEGNGRKGKASRGWGIGLKLWGDNCKMINCVARNNERGASLGEGEGATATELINCTIYNNKQAGVGIYRNSAIVRNCIIDEPKSAYIFLHKANAFEGGNNLYVRRAPGTLLPGSKKGDPKFVDKEKGDFHLQEGSAAIDAGSTNAPSIDYDGNKRPQGEGVDIGAFEYIVK